MKNKELNDIIQKEINGEKMTYDEMEKMRLHFIESLKSNPSKKPGEFIVKYKPEGEGMHSQVKATGDQGSFALPVNTHMAKDSSLKQFLEFELFLMGFIRIEMLQEFKDISK